MRIFMLTFLCCAALEVATAAEETKVEPGVDAPSRVARLSYKDGEVEMAPAGTEEWTDALLNRPLTTDDRLWVGNGAKAELQVGSTAIYLDADSGFSFLDLDDDLMHMSLTDGAATVRVRRKSENESIEIETPNATVTLLHPGEYHIQIAEGGAATVVDTRSGESEVAGEKDTFTVRANERGIFRGTDELTSDIKALGPRSSFEEWANERERRDVASTSSRYVSRDVIGYEDLDDDGAWSDDPEYGYVWTPTYVAAGWAPYRFGRWVWVSPWGWTWVDNYRWGFAPFHYGRWAYARDRWCWVPGPRHIRAVYAPALVGWVGGSGISVSIGRGVGWFPLGPREVYVPGYWHSRRYIHNVNYANTVIVNNTYIDNFGRGRYDYRYGRLPRAVTVVPRDRFVGGRPLEGYVRVGEPDLRRWHHDARPPAIAPDRNSVLASRVVAGRPLQRSLIRPHQLDADRNNSAFLARRSPPTRVPFEVERQAIEANRGRPVDRSRIISNDPRAVARNREDFRNEWTQRRSGSNPSRDADRNAQARQPVPGEGPRRIGESNRTFTIKVPPSARQPVRGEGPGERPSGPDKSFRDRDGLSDRPAWARQRGDAERSHEAQSETRTVTIPSRQRGDGSDRSRQEDRNPAPRQAGSPNATTGFNELRRDSGRPEWSRAQGSDRQQQFTPPPRQYEQPRAIAPRAEQPAYREQSRPERSYQRSSPPEPSRSERAAPRSPTSEPRQSRSEGSSRSSGEGRSERSFHNGR
jgi:hypothetical protein